MRRLTGVLVVIVLVTCLAAVGSAQTGGAASAGQMTWAVHFTLAPRWLDPARTRARSRPTSPSTRSTTRCSSRCRRGPPRRASPSRGPSPRTASSTTSSARQRALPQRRAGDRGGREVLLRALRGRQRDRVQGAREGGPRARPATRPVPPEGAVVGLHHLLRHHRDQRGMDRAEEVRGAGGRRGLQEGPDRRRALQGGQRHAGHRAAARGLRRLLAEAAAREAADAPQPARRDDARPPRSSGATWTSPTSSTGRSRRRCDARRA